MTDRPFRDEPAEVLETALGLASEHAAQADRFRPPRPDDALPAVADLFRTELQHREAAMTDSPAPQPAEEPLTHVGWWCWRGDNHGHLAATPCRSDNVSLHAPAEWADEMRAVIQRIEDGDDEDAPAAAPVPPPADRAALLREAAAADALVADARRAVHESMIFLAASEADRVRALIADLETAVEGRTAIRMGVPSVVRARVLHDAADWLDALPLSGVEAGVRAALTTELRRLAGEATANTEAEAPTAAPLPPASTALRIRVLTEILDRLLGGDGAGDSATEQVGAAQVRAVLAEILADMQRPAVVEQPFGSPDCTCIPFTRQGGKPRTLGPDDTVDMISGWERRSDCPHHRPAVVEQPDTQTREALTLPPPEGPEYTPCVCDHIEPEHAPDNGRCRALRCGCSAYQPTPPAPLRRSEDDCPGFPERCPNLRPVDPYPPVHLGGIRCGCSDLEYPE